MAPFLVRAGGGEITIAQGEGCIWFEILGETVGGQRRRVHLEMTLVELRELFNATQAFLKLIESFTDNDVNDPFPTGPRLRGIDGGGLR